MVEVMVYMDMCNLLIMLSMTWYEQFSVLFIQLFQKYIRSIERLLLFNLENVSEESLGREPWCSMLLLWALNWWRHHPEGNITRSIH